MSEWFKEPVLKTGDAQVSVGSNPTLSAKFNIDMQKYPRGRRGSPAKGVGWIKPARGFKSLLLRQLVASVIACDEFFIFEDNSCCVKRAAFAALLLFQIVPVTTSVAIPGVTEYSPVTGFCVYVAAGTRIWPGTVVNRPVVSL